MWMWIGLGLGAFVVIVQHLHGRPEPAACGIDPRAHVHPSATVGTDPSIYPMAYVGEGTVIGDRCRIHPGAVIGPPVQPAPRRARWLHPLQAGRLGLGVDTRVITVTGGWPGR